MDIQVVDTSRTDVLISKALADAKAVVIQNKEDYARCDSECKGLFKLRKAIEADFAESLRTADAAKRAATEAKSALVEQLENHIEPIHEAERIRKTKLLAWSDEQEALRRKEQDRLREEARKKAEDEALRKAEALEKQGKKAQADAVLAAPVKVASVVLPPAVAKGETVISEYFAYEITEPSEVKREFCSPDRGAIQKAMNLYKSQGKSPEEIEAIIGGIRVEKRIR